MSASRLGPVNQDDMGTRSVMTTSDIRASMTLVVRADYFSALFNNSAVVASNTSFQKRAP